MKIARMPQSDYCGGPKCYNNLMYCELKKGQECSVLWGVKGGGGG